MDATTTTLVEQAHAALEAARRVDHVEMQSPPELGPTGVLRADVRGDIAFRIVKTLTDKRATGGMRSMLRISQSTPDDRRPLVLAVLDNQPSSWTRPTQGAIDAAIVVAARELAKG